MYLHYILQRLVVMAINFYLINNFYLVNKNKNKIISDRSLGWTGVGVYTTDVSVALLS